MPFDSRKQQQWYHATDQTFLDDEPESARKVKPGGDKSEEVGEPYSKDLTTTAGGDLDENEKTLETPQGSSRENNERVYLPEELKKLADKNDNLEYERETYILSPEGHVSNDDDLEFEDNIYVKEVTEEEKEWKKDEPQAEEEFKEDEHPRDGGKFTSKGGGDSGKKETQSDEDVWSGANDEMKHLAVGNAMAGVTGIPDKWSTGKGEFRAPKWSEMNKKQKKLLSDQLRKDLDDPFYKGYGEDKPKEDKPKEDKPKEKKRFTLSSYKRNEGRNAHGANALNLVKQYGTPEELEEMEGIMKRHKKSGSIQTDDYKRRYEISNKYYSKLVKESDESYLKANEEFKEGEHPREDSGKFTSGGGSGGKSEEPQGRGSVDPDIPATADDVDWEKVSDDKLAKWSQAYPEDEDIKKEYDKRDKENEKIEVGKSSKELASMFTDKPKADWNNLDALRYASVLEGRSDRLKLSDFTQRDETTLFNRLDNFLQYKSQIDTFKKIVGIDGEMGNGYALKNRLWGKLNDKDKIKLLDFSTSLSNKSREVLAKEEGIGSVSGPPAGSFMPVMSNKVHVKTKDEKTDEIVGDEILGDDEIPEGGFDYTKVNENYIEFEGINYRPVYVGESRIITDLDLIFEGKYYTSEGIGNCPFCRGAGKVTVEKLGLKECPDCDGTGDVQQAPVQQIPDMMGQMNPQPEQIDPNDMDNQQNIAPDQPTEDGQFPEQPSQNPEEKQFPPEKPKFGEAKQTKLLACEKSMKQYEGFITRKLNILRKRAKANESVNIMYGLPTLSKNGKKIKGRLAYAGVSLNDRIYLPEELAKGDGLTLPLLLNHSNIAGAEEELDRLDDDMRDHLESEKDFKIGEVTLRWDQDELTLFYEGVIEHPFFQKEVDDANMAVSLGIYYDSDSPTICDESCYTIIKGAEFKEVSLVYHPGFPIATIEAVEGKIKAMAMKQMEKEKDEETVDSMSTSPTTTSTSPNSVTFTTDTPTGSVGTEIYTMGANFSVKGLESFITSSNNGTTTYRFNPTNAYEGNWIHFTVNHDSVVEIHAEELLQPKMTTPPELTKEIEKHPDIKITDADDPAFVERKKAVEHKKKVRKHS